MLHDNDNRFGKYTPDSVSQGFFSQWEQSTGHRANMLGESNKCGGVGIYGDGSTFYGTQIFSSSCVDSTYTPPIIPSVSPTVSPVHSPSPNTFDMSQITKGPTFSEQPEITVSPTVLSPSPSTIEVPQRTGGPTYAKEPANTVTPTLIFTFDSLPTTLPNFQPILSPSATPLETPEVTSTPTLTPKQRRRLRRLEHLITDLARLETKLVTCVAHAVLKKRKLKRCDKIKRRASRTTQKIQSLEKKLGSLVV